MKYYDGTDCQFIDDRNRIDPAKLEDLDRVYLFRMRFKADAAVVGYRKVMSNSAARAYASHDYSGEDAYALNPWKGHA